MNERPSQILPVVRPSTPRPGTGSAASPRQAAQNFLSELVRCGLLAARGAEEFTRRAGDSLNGCSNYQQVGRVLVGAGLLTEYQLGRVLSGTTHGLVLGNYRVLDRLGGGSVGVVFRGEHSLLRRQVAVKVLPVDEAFPADLLERFHAEMRVLAELHHPHIVTAYDAGIITPPEVGQPSLHYLVMELVDGGDLENYVYDHGPLSIPQACEWLRQAAGGLQAAHDRHLIHRDLKPSNLLLTKRGKVKLVDFGLARQFCSSLTEPKALLGSLEFMAPEQSIDPTAVSGRADIYALGATLFWLLTGHTPFPQSANPLKMLKVIQSESPRKLRDYLPEVPAELEALVAQMLDRDPQKRPATPIAVMNAMARFSAPVRPWELDAWAVANDQTLTDSSSFGKGINRPLGRVTVADADATVRTQLRAALEPTGCVVTEAADGNALSALPKASADLVLIDARLPHVMEAVRRLRERPPRPHLKIVILSAGPNDLPAALAHGADDCLPRTADIRTVTAKVHSLLQLQESQDRAARLAEQLLTANRHLDQSLQARAKDVRRAQDALLFAMAKMAESRDGENAAHLRRLQRYTAALAEQLRHEPNWAGVIDRMFLENLERCVPLHDIGKIGLPDHILLKPGQLDPSERKLMEQHTVIGAGILEAIGREYGDALAFLGMARVIVRHHHEKFDGTGYPDRLAGEAIPEAARLVAVADVYDALRRKRLHKPAMTHDQAVRAIAHESRGQFDPVVLQAFVASAHEFKQIYETIRA